VNGTAPQGIDASGGITGFTQDAVGNGYGYLPAGAAPAASPPGERRVERRVPADASLELPGML